MFDRIFSKHDRKCEEGVSLLFEKFRMIYPATIPALNRTFTKFVFSI